MSPGVRKPKSTLWILEGSGCEIFMADYMIHIIE